MKNASDIMFKIGKIFNIIAIVFSAIMIVVGIILFVSGGAAASNAYGASENQAAVNAITSGLGLTIGFIFVLVFAIISLIVCTKKKNEIDNGSNEVAPRVFIIVFGALAESVFYVLAGIFSLVARSQEMNSNNVQE